MVNLAHSYARVISDRGTDKKFMDQLLAVMKSRGHLSLLPQIARLVERMPAKNAAVVTVAKRDDAAKHKAGIETALKAVGAGEEHRLVVDENAVGGYQVVGNGKAVDRTFRSALVSLYQRIVN